MDTIDYIFLLDRVVQQVTLSLAIKEDLNLDRELWIEP